MLEKAQAVSFRDPAGKVAVLEDTVLRWVRPEGQDELQNFLESDTIRAAVAAGSVVSTEHLSDDEADELSHGVGRTTGDGPDRGVVVRHRRIPFPSYPYEWAPEMLEAAAGLTLDLHEGLVGEGMGLKDATPYNILFDGPRPVFVDALSVERRDPHDPVWTPYGQFIRTFLLPLLVARDRGIPLGTSLLSHRDGLTPEAVYGMTPPLARLLRPYRSLVTFPTWLAGKAERKGDALYAQRRMKDPDQARFTLEMAVRSLRQNLRRVSTRDATSTWSEYMATRDHYDDADARHKDRFVAAALERVRPEWVLDVGCNTGHFSMMAARGGARVVAVDLDPVSVGRLWKVARGEGLDVLPLVVDLSRPTPAMGWRNAESPSFLERAEGRFDMVFFLAVMHHLHVTERIPLDEIIGLAHRMGRRHVVFEYVGPDDPMFKRLLRGRGHLHAGLDRETFEKALEGRFGIITAEPLAGSDRVLYLLERVEEATTAVATPALEVA